eukprot:scaffold582_cov385-Prasinococcus_capsulatus_cf.AAC.41
MSAERSALGAVGGEGGIDRWDEDHCAGWGGRGPRTLGRRCRSERRPQRRRLRPRTQLATCACVSKYACAASRAGQKLGGAGRCRITIPTGVLLVPAVRRGAPEGHSPQQQHRRHTLGVWQG